MRACVRVFFRTGSPPPHLPPFFFSFLLFVYVAKQQKSGVRDGVVFHRRAETPFMQRGDQPFLRRKDATSNVVQLNILYSIRPLTIMTLLAVKVPTTCLYHVM